MEKREKIEKIIQEKINPLLSEHLGGMEYRDYNDGVLTVRFTGSCRGCYAAEDTLDNMVRVVFQQEMPEVKEFVIDNSVDQDLIDMARSLMGQHKA